MITYTEFFLFVSMMVTIGYALHWRSEASKWSHMFKLMVSDERARTEILASYENFKRRHG